ncbi:phenol hydroxylase [Corynebacterium kutscheri]|uniref:phenol hydroxylase n=1 Tax=Corynebacterium kutscheri TaxID=35755 RepID=UPI0037C170DE
MPPSFGAEQPSFHGERKSKSTTPTTLKNIPPEGSAHTSAIDPDLLKINTNDEDSWLDRVTEIRSQRKNFLHDLWHEFITIPTLWSRRIRNFLLTTPGKMSSVVAVLSLVIAVSSVMMSQDSADRRAQLETLVYSDEPVSHLTQNLYQSLSQADTAATIALVRVDEDQRQHYIISYQQASRAAALASAGLATDDTEEITLLSTINQLLPTYTGLVESAWVNSQQGNPVGVAYMSEASSLMRSEILPAARELHSLIAHKVAAEQRELTYPIWLPIGGLFFALVLLIITQFWLARLTHRRLNRGFVAATIILIVLHLWIGIAAGLTWSHGTVAYNRAALPLGQLTDARIIAQQARANETLALIRRQALDSSGITFTAATKQVTNALDQQENAYQSTSPTIATARRALVEWQHTHEQLTAQLSEGNFEDALATTLTPINEHTTTAYGTLDQALGTLIDETRATMREHIYLSIRASRFLNIISLVFGIIAVLSIWLGIRPRLQEYL